MNKFKGLKRHFLIALLVGIAVNAVLIYGFNFDTGAVGGLASLIYIALAMRFVNNKHVPSSD